MRYYKKILLSVSILTVLLSADTVDRGLKLYQSQKYFQAAQLLQPVYEKNRNEDIILPLFHIYIKMEKWQPAIALAREHEKPVLNEDKEKFFYIRALLQTGSYKEVPAVLRRCPQNKTYWSLYLRWLDDSGRYDKLKYTYIRHKDEIAKADKEIYIPVLIRRTAREYNKLFEQKKFSAALPYVRELVLLKSTPLHNLYLANTLFAMQRFQQTATVLAPLKADDFSDPANRFYFNSLKGICFFKNGEYQKSEVFLKDAYSLRPANADNLYYYAYALYKNGKIAVAYKKALAADKQKHNKESVYLLALTAIGLKDYGSARQWLAAYRKFDPGNKKIEQLLNQLDALKIYNKGLAAYNKENYYTAFSRFREALEVNKEVKPAVLTMLIRAANMSLQHEYTDSDTPGEEEAEKREELLEEGLEACEQLAEFTGYLVEALNGKFSLYKAQGDMEQARAAAETLEESLDDADSELLFKIGYTYEQENKIAKALKYYKLAYEQEEDKATAGRIIQLYENEAVKALNQKQIKTAVTFYQKITNFIPDSLAGRKLEVRIKSARNRKFVKQLIAAAEKKYSEEKYQEAISLYRKALTAKPGIKKLMTSLAACYYNLEKYEQSYDMYLTLWQQFAEEDALKGLLYSAKKLGNYKEVLYRIKKFREAKAGMAEDTAQALDRIQIEALVETGSKNEALAFIESKGPRRLGYEGSLLAGTIYFADKEYLKSEIYFNYALKNNPDSLVSLFNLGVVEKLKENFKAALAYFIQAEKIDKRPVIDYYMALIYWEMGNYKEGLVRVKRALISGYKPLDSAWLYCRLAGALIARGDNSELEEFKSRIAYCIKNKKSPEIAYKATRLRTVLFAGSAVTLSRVPREKLPRNMKPIGYRSGIFFFFDGNKKLAALDEITQEIKWQVTEAVPVSSTPVLGPCLFYSLENGFTKGIDLKHGRQLFRFRHYFQKAVADANNFYTVYRNRVSLCTGGKLSWTKEIEKVPALKFHKTAAQRLFMQHSNTVMVLDGRSGTLVSEVNLQNETYLAGFNAYLCVRAASNLVVYAADTGDKITAVRLSRAADPLVFTYGKNITVVEKNGSLFSFMPPQSEPEYTLKLPFTPVDTYKSKDNLFICDGDNQVLKVSLTRGVVVWQRDTDFKKSPYWVYFANAREQTE
ncbi:MAG TPA: tetratricopeptide repeat protein [Spirochaetota bacterium]|nr:tetratricopeptide repeat protein [Spirochaetota bacterium]